MLKTITNSLKRARDAEPEQRPVKISKIVPHVEDLNSNVDKLVFTETYGTVIVTVSGKDLSYYWQVPIKDFINDNLYVAKIVHNYENKAMLDFSDVITKELVYRVEINPLYARDVEEWVVDEQY